MKNLKNIVAVIISIVSMITLLTTQWAFSVGAPNVEINNHQTSGPDTVRFIITDVNTKKEVANPYVKRNAQWNDNGMIDVSHKLRIEVWSSPTDHRAFMINPVQGKKTIYLSWDPAKSSPLYPQTGSWGGFSGKTDSGFPLDKKTNVEASQITPTNIPLAISSPGVSTPVVNPVVTGSLKELETGRSSLTNDMPTSFTSTLSGGMQI